MTEPEDRVAEKPCQAVVRAVLPTGLYECELEDGRVVKAHLAGTMRTAIVRLIPGDTVTVQVSAFDGRKARVVGKG